MKGIITSGRLRHVGLLLLLLLGGLQSSRGDNLQAVIVKSSDNSYFNQTIETLIKHAEDHTQFNVINSDELNASSEILRKSNIVVTLGATAANSVASQSLDQLVLNAYVTDRQTDHFKNRNQKHIAVLLNQPLERYLAFSQQLLNLKSLGTISHTNLSLNSRQEKIRKKLDLKLNQYRLGDTNKKLLSVVRQLIKNNEALLMLPDQTIFNRDTLKGVLLTTYRSRTPVISYSPGHVKSGALAAIYSSPTDIGRHLANLVNRYHKGSLNPNHQSVYAQYYSIAINNRVARSLGLELTDEEELRKLIDGLTK
jgi:putative ABC transport system substrate-binding protein